MTTTLLTSCVDNGNDEPAAAPSPAPSSFESVRTVLDISMSSTTASVGKAITFAALGATKDSIVSYNWKFDDGQTATGQSVSVAFKAGGRVTATLTAVTSNNETYQTTALVFVSDGTSGIAASLGLPAMLADATQDNKVDGLDALAVAQSVYGTTPLSETAYVAADINLDGVVDRTDLALVMDAVLDTATLPTAVLNPYLYPGSVISVVSPTLLDPDSVLQIKANGAPVTNISRILPGYATAILPSNLSTVATTISVQLVSNGVAVKQVDVPLRQLPAMPANAQADIQALIDQTESLLVAQQTLISNQANGSGAPAADIANAVASAKAGVALLESAKTKLAPLLTADSGILAQTLQKALYANGLAEFRAALSTSKLATNGATERPLALLTPDQVCDIMIPAVCGLKKTAQLTSTSAAIFSAACSVTAATLFALASAQPEFEPGVLAGFVEVCVPLATAAELGSYAALIFSPLDAELQIAATPVPQTMNATWTTTASVSFFGLREVCAESAGQLGGVLAKRYLGRKIVAGVLRNNTSLKLLAQIFARVSDRAYEALLDAIQASVTNLLDATGLSNAVGSFVGDVCPNLTAGAATVPASRVFQQPAANQGTLQFNSDATGTYTCPAPGTRSTAVTTLTGSLQLCETDPATKMTSFTCGGSQVTITMGDNGNLLDDIFEVIINGETVLTSSVPVRSVSTTVSLPSGNNVVTMRGLAAPDGVGTYFISFAGATVVSGQVTGTDLTPGVEKQFVIRVQ